MRFCYQVDAGVIDLTQTEEAMIAKAVSESLKEEKRLGIPV